MENKEETSFLPVKGSRVTERQHSIQRPFLFLQITAMVVMFCWLVFLTLSPQQRQSSMSADVIRQLKQSQDVREGRQVTSETILEGDIVVHNTVQDSSALDAHLADPDRLWPSGLVEYKFSKSFPASSQKMVKWAMAYITTRLPCITFEEATSSTVDYVLFREGLKCNSQLGRIGGEQVINLNRGCFSNGLMTTVHELLHTLGFVHEHTRLDDETWPEPDPDDPLSIVDEVELSLAYQCSVSQESLLKYVHFNRHHNTLLIEQTIKMVKENRRLIDDMKPVAIPVPCKTYNVLDSAVRHFQAEGGTFCDNVGKSFANSDWKGTGWYRVTGGAGSKLIESPVEARKFCGTAYTGWLDGGHPTANEGEVTRTVYFNDGSNTKHNPQSVNIINCNNEYFVYHLLDLSSCYLAYCTE